MKVMDEDNVVDSLLGLGRMWELEVQNLWERNDVAARWASPTDKTSPDAARFLSLPGHISHWAKDIDVMDGAIDVADADTPDGPQFSSKMFWRGWDKGPWRAGADGLPVQPDPDELYDGLKYWAD